MHVQSENMNPYPVHPVVRKFAEICKSRQRERERIFFFLRISASVRDNARTFFLICKRQREINMRKFSRRKRETYYLLRVKKNLGLMDIFTGAKNLGFELLTDSLKQSI